MARRGLTLDLINEILLRLPASSLARFRCVSKPWSSLISNPLFLRDHHDRSRHKALLLVAETHRANPNTLRLSTLSSEGGISKYSSITVPEYVKMEHSSGDVICLTRNSSVFLCNPATGELVALPAPIGSNGYHRFGFGYVASLGQFKVARFGYMLSYEVFTVGTDRSWREIGRPPCRVDESRGIPFLNGALHLLPSSMKTRQLRVSPPFDENGTDQYEDECRRDELFVGNGIAAFDLELETWSMVPLPSFDCDEKRELRLDRAMLQISELKGLLCLGVGFPHMLHLRLLMDYDSGRWVKEYSISFFSLRHACHRPQVTPVAIMDDGRILLDSSELGLLFYDRRDERLTEIEGSRGWRARVYVENIFLSLREPFTI
ncbi:F-box protein At3g07870-like [Elaeis guineensis]|uniref:F-box protein At1g60370 n=1 Tax=Elaeis guineensis var. tenera TaxID=51953 RepID=A0A6I9QSR6_ELAGV|nr:putative F-box protein At1g60370 [Elaeis guineensis]